MPTTVYHVPEQKVEAALKVLIEALELDFPISLRFDDEEVDASRIVIVAEEADPEIIGETITGNWTMEVQIILKTMRVDVTGESHDAAVGQIADMIFSSDIESQLNGAGIEDLTVFSAYPGKRSNSITDDARQTIQRVQVYMMPSVEEEPA